MITKITSIEELTQLYIQFFLNTTDKVTKVSEESVLAGTAKGTAKLAQKALKEIAIVESHLFPDSAFGDSLDSISEDRGIAARFGASQSSVYVRVVGVPGTSYFAGIHIVSTNTGVSFDIEEDLILGEFGFGYIKCRSQNVGKNQNVEALSIMKISPTPSGHKYLVNEYRAVGGRDVEQDDVLKLRIKEGPNVLAEGTVSKIEQVFMKINNNVLRVIYQGLNNESQIVLAIVTQNGINLTVNELDNLLDKGTQYFSLTDLRPYGNSSYGIYLKNIEWQPIDISFRIDFLASYNPDDIRKEIQIKISKYLDFRFWKSGDQVEWDNLLEIVKSVKGVKYAPDTFFIPGSDIKVDKNKLPRLRGFLMYNLEGDIISNLAGSLNPVYYPNSQEVNYQQTVLMSI